MSYSKNEGIETSFIIESGLAKFNNGIVMNKKDCGIALQNLRKTDFEVYKGAKNLLPLYEKAYQQLCGS